MAKTNGAPKKAPFKPKDLSLKDQALVVEEFLGIHPDFFLYKGLNIQLNMGKFRNHYRGTGVSFNGWKPKSGKYNSTN